MDSKRQSVKRRQCLPLWIDSLDTLCKMPTERDVLGRLNVLVNIYEKRRRKIALENAFDDHFDITKGSGNC